jgi:hypothetical protein
MEEMTPEIKKILIRGLENLGERLHETCNQLRFHALWGGELSKVKAFGCSSLELTITPLPKGTPRIVRIEAVVDEKGQAKLEIIRSDMTI